MRGRTCSRIGTTGWTMLRGGHSSSTNWLRLTIQAGHAEEQTPGSRQVLCAVWNGPSSRLWFLSIVNSSSSPMDLEVSERI